MYTILINDDNTMSATQKARIIQRSKLVDDFWFLASPVYNGHDMSGATVLMEYLKPVSRQYKTEILTLSPERYKDYLKYTLPVDTEFTKEAGALEILLSFIYLDIDADGKPVQRVRKIAPALTVDIYPISAWSDIIPDEALTAIDQRIMKQDAQIKALADMADIFDMTKADDLKYDTDENTLQLMAAGKEIGNAVKLKTGGMLDEDGVPVVDFSDSNDDIIVDEEDDSNVIEF